jgi:hypothetical protein
MVKKTEQNPYKAGFEKIKENRSKGVSQEEYLAQRMKVLDIEKEPTQENDKTEEIIKDTILEHPQISSRMQALFNRYEKEQSSLNEADCALLNFFYFGKYNPSMLSVPLLCDYMSRQPKQVRTSIKKLAIADFIDFRGFSLGKNKPLTIGLYPSAKQFLAAQTKK